MKANLQSLQDHLKEFGLNPSDWVLETKNTIGTLFHLHIHSKEDRELVLQGWAEQEAWLVVSYQG